jgi:hypothetical protein
MFCSNCGAKIDQGGLFCPNCGQSASVSVSEPASLEKGGALESRPEKTVFYSEDWERKKGFLVTSGSRFDVMVDENFLFAIKLPSYNASTWGLLVGLLVLNILGAAIGAAIGQSRDTKKRQWYRSAWINSEKKLTSRHYMDDVFVAVPLTDLKGNIVFGKKKFTLTYDDKNIVLQKHQKEFERFKLHIQKYVL